jgi:DNA-binding protein YbaB
VGYEQESVHEVENILKVAAKKEEMASIQKMQQALDQAQEEISKLQAEIDWKTTLWPVRERLN